VITFYRAKKKKRGGEPVPSSTKGGERGEERYTKKGREPLAVVQGKEKKGLHQPTWGVRKLPRKRGGSPRRGQKEKKGGPSFTNAPQGTRKKREGGEKTTSSRTKREEERFIHRRTEKGLDVFLPEVKEKKGPKIG